MKEKQKVPTVPKKYAGLWIAWNNNETKIIASGHNFRETREAALAAGEDDPILAKAPQYNSLFVGAGS